MAPTIATIPFFCSNFQDMFSREASSGHLMCSWPISNQANASRTAFHADI